MTVSSYNAGDTLETVAYSRDAVADPLEPVADPRDIPAALVSF